MSAPTTDSLPAVVSQPPWYKNILVIFCVGAGLFTAYTVFNRTAHNSAVAAATMAGIVICIFGYLAFAFQNHRITVTSTTVTQRMWFKEKTFPVTNNTIAYVFTHNRHNQPGIVVFDTTTHDYLTLRAPSKIQQKPYLHKVATALETGNIPFHDPHALNLAPDFPEEELEAAAYGKKTPFWVYLVTMVGTFAVIGFLGWLAMATPSS